ncbi:MAG TPA: phospholipid carrier-dependent glycosyltransferase, partial [Phototrophicaceae bacterium]|nr:phospholipid carrier-dependent glycosyltransferase [Phototrophicaceae bacterium]
LARQIGAGRWGALAAGLIMGLCGQAVQSSFVTMSDIPALFWATLSGVILIHYRHDQKLRWIVLAALTLAIACITRWIYLALIPVWAAAVLITWRRIRWRESVAAAIAAGLILIPQAAVSVHSPYPVLDHAWVEGWSPLNAFAHEFSNVDGHFVYPEINAQYYAMPFYDAYFLAPIFTPFLLIGLWALRRKLVLLLLLLAWALLPYLFLAGIPYQNIRFPLIVVPAVAALVGLGLHTAFTWRQRAAPLQPNRLLEIGRAMIFVAVVAVGLALMGNIGRQNVRTFINNQQADKTAVAWAIQHIPTGTRLYTFGVTEPLQIYSQLEVHELYDETEASISDQLKDRKESYVFVNVWQIENQFAGHDLQKTFNWMYQYLGLQQLGQIGYYTLYKVIDEDLNAPAGVQQPSG